MEKRIKLNNRSIFYTALSALISMLLMYLMLVLIAPKVVHSIQKEKVETKVDTKTKNISDTDALTKDEIITSCLNDNTIVNKDICWNLNLEQELNPIHDENIKIYEDKESTFEWVYKQIVSTSPFIQLIYFIVFYTLMELLNLFIVIRFHPYRDDLYQKYIKRVDTLSDFAVGVPITFGVAATIFAFGNFSMTSNSSLEFMDLFKANIYDATTTTLLGAMIYGITMRMNIHIQERVRDEKLC